jgi:hypothetical protein
VPELLEAKFGRPRREALPFLPCLAYSARPKVLACDLGNAGLQPRTVWQLYVE